MAEILSTPPYLLRPGHTALADFPGQQRFITQLAAQLRTFRIADDMAGQVAIFGDAAYMIVTTSGPAEWSCDQTPEAVLVHLPWTPRMDAATEKALSPQDVRAAIA